MKGPGNAVLLSCLGRDSAGYVSVLLPTGVRLFMCLESLLTYRSMSSVSSQFPTNQQRVNSYSRLTLGPVGDGSVQIINGASLMDVTVE